MLNGYLRQSTAAQSRMIGPFVDESTGKAETGLTIANTDIKLSKNGAAGVNKNSGGGTHRNNGMYSITFDATDTDTIGELSGSVDMESPIFANVVAFKFIVLKAEIYDALYSSTPTLLTSLDIGQLYESTVATVNSQTSFDMDGTILNDDAWIGNIVIINDISASESVTRWVTDVDQANDRIIISSAPPFTVVAGDILRVESRTHPTYSLESVNPTNLYNSTISTVNSQVSFDMNDNIVSDDNWIGNTAIITDVSTEESVTRYVTDVDQANDRIIIDSAPPFTVVATDRLRVESRIHPSYSLGIFTPPPILQRTTINTYNTQTDFTLVAGSTDDDAYNNCIMVITDSVTSTQKCVGIISDYTGSTKTVALDVDPGVFTMAVGDFIDIIAPVGVTALNGAEVIGTGSSGDKWRGN
jgi:hypothetical protein